MTNPPEPRTAGCRRLDRIVSLSDGVFATAIALLALAVEVPQVPKGLLAQELLGRLLALEPQYLSYVIRFLVVLLYWTAHHDVFRAIRGYDGRLIWLNGVFLMFVAFGPFPMELLRE